MERHEATRLRALLFELETLCHQTRLSVEHTFFRMPGASEATVKKYKRSDADVAVWLDRLAATQARITQLRREVRSLDPENNHVA